MRSSASAKSQRRQGEAQKANRHFGDAEILWRSARVARSPSGRRRPSSRTSHRATRTAACERISRGRILMASLLGRADPAPRARRPFVGERSNQRADTDGDALDEAEIKERALIAVRGDDVGDRYDGQRRADAEARSREAGGQTAVIRGTISSHCRHRCRRSHRRPMPPMACAI